MAAYQAGRISDEGVRAVQTAMMDHCANMQRPRGDHRLPAGHEPAGRSVSGA